MYDVKQKAKFELCVRWRKGFLRMGAGKFAETPRASPFNKDLSNEAIYNQIHLAG
jgi:hypothetical protein